MLWKKIYIKRYDWFVYCFFGVERHDSAFILSLLNDIGISSTNYHRAKDNLLNGKYDSGFTYSVKRNRKSVIVVGKASSKEEYLNTISHELRHLCDDIANTDDIDMSGEEVAYLTGDVTMQLYEPITILICECPNCKKLKYGERVRFI